MYSKTTSTALTERVQLVKSKYENFDLKYEELSKTKKKEMYLKIEFS